LAATFKKKRKKKGDQKVEGKRGGGGAPPSVQKTGLRECSLLPVSIKALGCEKKSSRKTEALKPMGAQENGRGGTTGEGENPLTKNVRGERRGTRAV